MGCVDGYVLCSRRVWVSQINAQRGLPTLMDCGLDALSLQ